jgi:hypothetical protein
MDPNRAEPSPTTVPPTDYTKAQLFRLVERMDQRAMRTERAVERCMAMEVKLDQLIKDKGVLVYSERSRGDSRGDSRSSRETEKNRPPAGRR